MESRSLRKDVVQHLGKEAVRKKRIHDFGDGAVISGDTMSHYNRMTSSPTLLDKPNGNKVEKNISHLTGTTVHIHLLSNMHIQLFIHSITKHYPDIILG